MPKRRRLTDLYRRGQMEVFADGDGEPIEVWLQKPNKIEMESIYRRANAAKARFIQRADDESSDEFQSALSAVMDIDDDDLLFALAQAEELGRIRARIEAELETDEEWAEDDKLQALYDAWQGDDDNPGLRDAYALDPEGETLDGAEAKRVFDELSRFNDQVEAAFAIERDHMRRDMGEIDVRQMQVRAARTFVNNEANEVFYREFQRQQIFYGVRDPDERDKRYFGELAEIDLLDDTVLTRLQLALNDFVVEPPEGKDSPATTDSSPQSEQPETVEPSQDSGQGDAAA